MAGAHVKDLLEGGRASLYGSLGTPTRVALSWDTTVPVAGSVIRRA